MAHSANPTHPTAPSKGGSHRANALPPGHLLDEYRIESILGAGGFGVTYKALDTHLESWVAIKEYFPIEWSYRDADGVTVYPNTQGQESSLEGQPADYIWGLERFLDEARVLARIQHPFVVRVKRYFRSHGTAYIVMDYEEGEPLNAILRDGETLSEEEVRGLLEDVLPALKTVHEQGYLHRDIKPANLYRRARDHRVMLIDFGAARAALNRHSKSVTSLVTPGYSPPEQYTTRNDRYGTWTDVYALGAVLYRCITGRTPAEAAERLLDDTLEPAVQVGAGRYSTNLLKVIDRALAVRPEHRFSNAIEMQAALAGVASEDSDETVVMMPLLKPGYEPDDARATPRPAASVLEVSSGGLLKPAGSIPENYRPAGRRPVIKTSSMPTVPGVATPKRRPLLAVVVGVVALTALAGTGLWLWPAPPKDAGSSPDSLSQNRQSNSPSASEHTTPTSASQAASPTPPIATPPIATSLAPIATNEAASPPVVAQAPEAPLPTALSSVPPLVSTPPSTESISSPGVSGTETAPLEAESASSPGVPGTGVALPEVAQPLPSSPPEMPHDLQTATESLPTPADPVEPAGVSADTGSVAADAAPKIPGAIPGGSPETAPPATKAMQEERVRSKSMSKSATDQRSAIAARTRSSARNRSDRRQAPFQSSPALSSAPVHRAPVAPIRKGNDPWDPPASTGFNQK